MVIKKLQLPDREEFAERLRTMTYMAVAESYGVSLFSVAQWRIAFGLPEKTVPLPSKEVLQQHIDDGMSNREIASQYAVDESTVGKWRKKHGLPGSFVKMPSKEELGALIEMMPNTEIAKKYGVGLRLVSKWRVKLGLANVWKKQMVNWEEFDRDSCEMRWQKVCEKYNISLSVMQLWKQKRGLTSGKAVDRKITWVEDGDGCWVCTSHAKDSLGYVGNRGELIRRMWIEKNGVWPEGMMCLHTCDNKLCVNPNHVVPGTHADNQKDMAEKHRSPWGDRNGVRKLNSSQAKDIYAERGRGISQDALGRKYGVSGTTIGNIWRGKTWVRDVRGMDNFPMKLSVGKKMSWSEVNSVRSMMGKRSARETAKIYGITHRMVLKIWNNESWKVIE